MKKSILFSIFGFIVVSSATVLVILYANGYNYNIGSNSIQQTGVIKVTSTPGGGDVYLDGNYQGSSPVSIFNLHLKTILLK